MKENFKKYTKLGLRILFLGLGIWLAILVFRHLELDKLAEVFHHLGWKIVIIWSIPLLWLLAQTLAWHLTVEETGAHISFAQLLIIKITGDAINPLTPLGFIGGDPVRFSMLKKKMPGTISAVSVVLDRTVQSLAIVVMLIFTLILAPFRLDLPTAWKTFFPIMTAIMAGILWVSIHHQRKGVFVRLSHMAQKFGVSLKKIDSLREELQHIDQRLLHFYRHSPGRFLSVLICHLVGRLGLVFEIYVIAFLLGTPIHLDGALFMAMLAVLINIFFIFIPAGMGILEGGYGALGILLKIGPTAGVAIQLIRRLRALFWILVGVVFVLITSPGTLKVIFQKTKRGFSLNAPNS